MSYNDTTEVYRLREILWAIYEACGEDTDGLTHAPLQGTWDPDIPEAALMAVLDLASEYDALLDEYPDEEEY